MYEELNTDLLDEEFPAAMEKMPNGGQFIDLIGGGSEEDINISMRFYADDEERQRWLEDFPEYEMPPKEKPQFDRDRLLPKMDGFN